MKHLLDFFFSLLVFVFLVAISKSAPNCCVRVCVTSSAVLCAVLCTPVAHSVGPIPFHCTIEEGLLLYFIRYHLHTILKSISVSKLHHFERVHANQLHRQLHFTSLSIRIHLITVCSVLNHCIFNDV